MDVTVRLPTVSAERRAFIESASEETLTATFVIGLDAVERTMTESSELKATCSVLRESVEEVPDLVAEYTKKAMLECMQPLNQKIADITEKLTGSKSKGEVGELIFESVMEQYFPHAIVESTTKKAHAGDFTVRFPGCEPFIVEVKMYNKAVPVELQNRFRRDVRRRGARHGLMVNLSDGFCRLGRFAFVENEVTAFYVGFGNEQVQSVVAAVCALRALTRKAPSPIDDDKLVKSIKALETATANLDKLKATAADMARMGNDLVKGLTTLEALQVTALEALTEER